MYLLGFDVGTSSVKASLINAATGVCAASDYFPKQEMRMTAVKPGWAEQDPELWWHNLCMASASILANSGIDRDQVRAIGISYQMHGLVMVDKYYNVLRPSIIWCDSRAVGYGDEAAKALGSDYCYNHLLNSPGNFTASKLAWVKENEPEIYAKIYKVMLPGDYIAMKMTGEVQTTIPGLSEGILWDFKREMISDELINYYGFDKAMMPDVVPTFSKQAGLSADGAFALGLRPGTPVSYRAGDQPNNALSLNVFKPGEVASTAGTSGVIYGVLDRLTHDDQNRVNLFAHVNHKVDDPRLGMLLCINGTGSMNAWIKKQFAPEGLSYEVMNMMAESIPVGSDGVSILPFGNGAERVLGNRETGAVFSGLNFNVHTRAHIFRAVQEGVVFAMKYGLDVMEELGLKATTIRAGAANMYRSDIFSKTMATLAGVPIELYETTGASGAAQGAGIGAGIYADSDDAFAKLQKMDTIEPDIHNLQAYQDAYEQWKLLLNNVLKCL